jgi:PAS domain S-box-containing protein
VRSTESPSTPDLVASLNQTVLQTVFEGSPIGVGVCDEDGRFVAVNPALTGMLSRRREEMVGRPFLTFVHPEQRSASLACYFRSVVAAAAASPPATEHTELRCLSSDGSVVSVSVTWTITKPNQAGQQYGIVHLSDITERRHSEADSSGRSPV